MAEGLMRLWASDTRVSWKPNHKTLSETPWHALCSGTQKRVLAPPRLTSLRTAQIGVWGDILRVLSNCPSCGQCYLYWKNRRLMRGGGGTQCSSLALALLTLDLMYTLCLSSFLWTLDNCLSYILFLQKMNQILMSLSFSLSLSARTWQVSMFGSRSISCLFSAWCSSWGARNVDPARQCQSSLHRRYFQLGCSSP